MISAPWLPLVSRHFHYRASGVKLCRILLFAGSRFAVRSEWHSYFVEGRGCCLWALGPSLQWRWLQIFRVTAMVALYLNFMLLVSELFKSVPFLGATAPLHSVPLISLTQVVVWNLYVALAIVVATRLHSEQLQSA
jgi:hypothetical protein